MSGPFPNSYFWGFCSRGTSDRHKLENIFVEHLLKENGKRTVSITRNDLLLRGVSCYSSLICVENLGDHEQNLPNPDIEMIFPITK